MDGFCGDMDILRRMKLERVFSVKCVVGVLCGGRVGECVDQDESSSLK